MLNFVNSKNILIFAIENKTFFINLKFKKMKKILSFVAIAAVMMFAGKANAQLSVHAGYQSYSLHNNGFSVSDDGFYAGFSYNAGLDGGFGVAPGVYFAYVEDVMDIRVPILMNYVLHVNDLGFGLFLGPNVTVGIAGDMYGDIGNMKRFDVGITFGGQVSYQKISLEVGYNLGLLKRFDGADTKSNHFFVGLGYAL